MAPAKREDVSRDVDRSYAGTHPFKVVDYNVEAMTI
jgi:hypothetical protein